MRNKSVVILFASLAFFAFSFTPLNNSAYAAEGGVLPIECGTCLYWDSMIGVQESYGRCFLQPGGADCGPVYTCNGGSSENCSEYMCRVWDARCSLRPY